MPPNQIDNRNTISFNSPTGIYCIEWYNWAYMADRPRLLWTIKSVLLMVWVRPIRSYPNPQQKQKTISGLVFFLFFLFFLGGGGWGWVVSITARRCSDRSVDLEAVMIFSSCVCACWNVGTSSSSLRMVRFQAVNHHLRERQGSVGASTPLRNRDDNIRERHLEPWTLKKSKSNDATV